MIRRTAALVTALLAVLCLAAGCGKSEENAGRKPYGEETAFDGPAHEVGVFFVNAGKADCAIVSVDSHVWLIDTGTAWSFPNVYAALRLMGVGEIEGVILTHGHSDHVGGLYAVSRAFRVGTVVYPALLNDSEPIESAISENKLAGYSVTAGESIFVTEGVSFRVLGPTELDKGEDNDNSLVVKLEVNGRSFLFTGDMQFDEDGRLLRAGKDVLCDVLKVPNHGNPDALSAAFAEAADPQIAVISTNTSVDVDSANPAVLNKLENADVYITQDYELGVLLTVSEKGAIGVSFPERPAPTEGLGLAAVSKETQSFTIVNNSGSRIDLSGFSVMSTKGYEVFVFPEGASVPAGGSILVACKNSSLSGSADIIWREKKVWAANKDDWAVLYDPWGNELGRMISE